MFSRILCQKVYFATKGIVGIASPRVAVVCRGYRNRVLHRSADDPIGAGESVTMSPSELGGNEQVESESIRLADSEGAETEDSMAAVANSTDTEVDVPSPESLSEEELAALEKETDHVFRLDDGEDDGSSSCMKAERVTKRNFEDEFFRLSDAMNRKKAEEDASSLGGPAIANESVTFVEGDDAKSFFDKIMALNENEITTEDEKKRISIIRDEQKEEAKEVKRNTWFNFMPAKERPDGFMDSYTPDQIYSALEFDLLSRNASEVYKYEKDDMLLTEDVLMHAKIPEPIQAPKIPLYPKFEEYAKWVTFAVNRNGDYSQEDKQRVVDILQRLGSLDAEIDESPKGTFKVKKYM